MWERGKQRKTKSKIDWERETDRQGVKHIEKDGAYVLVRKILVCVFLKEVLKKCSLKKFEAPGRKQVN